MKRPTLIFLNRLNKIRSAGYIFVSLIAMVSASCSELEKPKVEPFFALSVPPRKQELRWGNGRSPKSLDPASAAAAPETDIIRAIYDGLTDLDSKSLREIPGVAERWESSKSGRIWTFYLRNDARWTNGERVTARDFVRSWRRLGDLKEKAANRFLFQNIIGLKTKDEASPQPIGAPTDFLRPTPLPGEPLPSATQLDPRSAIRTQITGTNLAEGTLETGKDGRATEKRPAEPAFGVEAIGDGTLRVTLEIPDPDFPKLVANPVFRPVYGDWSGVESSGLDPHTVTNGAFRITKIADDGISLERSESFWNRKSVALENLKFVSSSSAETALEAYKKGEIDVLTNAAFEPLALKLLTPFEDFRQTPHSALNFYELNISNPPFNDRRIREALAISIDREKLTEGELEGTMRPANTFFPNTSVRKYALPLEIEKARQLMDKAGFPNGSGFPAIRLVINRNDVQQRVARSVARMWKQGLNLDTIINVKETNEIEAIRRSGDFDVIRRGIVLPANDEVVNLTAIFGSARKKTKPGPEAPLDEVWGPTERPLDQSGISRSEGDPQNIKGDNKAEPNGLEPIVTISEADAMYDLQAIPLYFPLSYSLVKPYVRGFEMNALDAPSLKEINIDSEWKPRAGPLEQ